MSTVQDWPGPAGTPLSPPPMAPNGPAGESGMGARPDGPSRGRRRLVLIALLVALVLACACIAAVAGMAAAPVPEAVAAAAVAAKVDPCLADVTATLGTWHDRAEGTGIVLTSTGEVLTNNHVIEDATSITVTDVGNGHTYPAAVVGYDRQRDIAVLQLHGAFGLRAVTLGSSSDLTVGQTVLALGNAGGKGGMPAVTIGTITGLDQAITAFDWTTGMSGQLTGLIASTAGIAAGDSGGPLVSTAGRVVGVNTAASSPSRFPSVTQAQAYSIPASQAASIASQIEAGQASATVHIGATAFLGVTIMVSGIPGLQYADAAVTAVMPGSPAAAAGLTAGDVITRLGTHQIASASAVESVIGQYYPGQRISIGWLDRASRPRTATVMLTSGPAG